MPFFTLKEEGHNRVSANIAQVLCTQIKQSGSLDHPKKSLCLHCSECILCTLKKILKKQVFGCGKPKCPHKFLVQGG